MYLVSAQLQKHLHQRRQLFACLASTIRDEDVRRTVEILLHVLNTPIIIIFIVVIALLNQLIICINLSSLI